LLGTGARWAIRTAALVYPLVRVFLKGCFSIAEMCAGIALLVTQGDHGIHSGSSSRGEPPS